MALTSSFAQSGLLMANDVDTFVSDTSFYFQPTRENFLLHRQEWNPQEVLNTILSHVPGGRSSVKVRGSVVRTYLSVVLVLDLGGMAVDNGLSPAQSFSKHLFLNAGIMAFYTGSGRMVRHTAITQPWASGSRATPTRTAVPKVQDGVPELVHIVAPPHARESEVKKVALLLGTLRSFERVAAAASLDSCFTATYMQRQSAVLASDFALEGVRFYPHAPDPHA